MTAVVQGTGTRQFRQRVMVLTLRLVHLCRGEELKAHEITSRMRRKGGIGVPLSIINITQLPCSSMVLRQAIYVTSAVAVIVSLAVDPGGEKISLWSLVERWIGMETEHVPFYP